MKWAGTTALVTGAAGFIGSHLVERLLEEGATVRALVRYNSSHTAGFLDDVSGHQEGLEIIYGDICDSQCVSSAIARCDVVFHLAALISIPYWYIAPESYLDTNVRGTLNVLQAARAHEGVRVIQTSTSEVYGTPETVPIVETHPLHPQSPYAATKVASDQLALSYHRTFGVPVTVLRPFNTYGPRQSTRAVVPAILAQLLAGCVELRLGALDPRRDLTYVSDTVDGFLKAAESDAAIGQTIQLGTGHDISIGELADRLIKMTNSRAVVVEDHERLRPVSSEVARLLSDPSFALTTIGWAPRVTLDDGLNRTIDWLTRSHVQHHRTTYVV